MRVLLVSQEMPPETAWGGIGTYVDVLSEALAEMGVEVHVLSVVPGQETSTVQRGRVIVHRHGLRPVAALEDLAPESWVRLALPAAVRRLASALAPQPTVVECPEWKAEGLALALRPPFPLVVRLHSSARQLFGYTGQGTRRRGLDGRLAAWLEDVSARRAHVVVSTASNLAEVADPLALDRRAVHAIPYPVRLPPPRPLADAGPPRVLFAGRLEPRKGPEVVLRAAPAVLAEMPDARFTFIGRDVMTPGSPSSSAWLTREAERLGVAHAVELRGQLDRHALLDARGEATVAAFPSRWESFGNVVAEAAAVGRPVVVSSIPPFRELVRDGVTGRIVAGEDPEAWAGALLPLLGDRALARTMGAAGARHVAGISDPARVAELALAAYENAIARAAAGLRAGLPRRR